MEYFVEYIDEFGNHNSENWSQRTLDQELKDGIVKITSISPAYHILVQLGLESDD